MVATLLHYSWLATFTAINVLALKMVNTFSSDIPAEGSYIPYAVCSLSVPLLITVPCIAMDLTNSGLFYYTHDSSCWVSNRGKIDRFYSFTVPVLACVFVNLLLFTVSGGFLLKSFWQGRNVNSQRDRLQIFLVFVKLFSLTGLSWVFGYLPEVTGNSLYWYPFTVFNCLQGLYTFVAFGCSGPARTHLKHLLWGTNGQHFNAPT